MPSALIPRLVVRLRSAFPEATVECLGKERLKIVLGPQAPRAIEVSTVPVEVGCEAFQIVQARMAIRFECLEGVSEIDYNRFIASENYGLRGVTVLRSDADPKLEGRSVILRSSFLGLKGRTQDEAENALIDILSMVRFARLLEDRVLRSSAAGSFCFEMYQSQYLTKGGLRNRYINYARSVFRGSAERIFGEVERTLRDDHLCSIEPKHGFDSSILQPSTNLGFEMRVPDETPMLIFTSQMKIPTKDIRKLVMLANQWNAKIASGHFEVGLDPRTGEPALSFIQWKHLTNDLRLYAIDYVLLNLGAALQSASAQLRTEAAAKEAVQELRPTTAPAPRRMAA